MPGKPAPYTPIPEHQGQERSRRDQSDRSPVNGMFALEGKRKQPISGRSVSALHTQLLALLQRGAQRLRPHRAWYTTMSVDGMFDGMFYPLTNANRQGSPRTKTSMLWCPHLEQAMLSLLSTVDRNLPLRDRWLRRTCVQYRSNSGHMRYSRSCKLCGSHPAT